MSLPRLLSVAALATAMAACGSPFGPGTDRTLDLLPGLSSAAVVTDSQSYTLRKTNVGYTGVVGVTFTNATTGTAHVVNCNGSTSLIFEKLVDGEWKPSWGPAIPQCLSAPIIVQPGRAWSTVVHVFSGFPGSNYQPQFVTEIPGTYRIVYHDILRSFDSRRYPFGEPIPASVRTSNAFELRLEQ